MDSLRTRLAVFAQEGMAWSAFLMTFLLPTVFYLRTYDSAMIKITLAQLGTLFLIFFWIIKTVETGRLEWPLPSQKVLLPGILFLAWLLLGYALSPFKAAALYGFIKMTSFVVLFCIGCAELGNLRFAKRLTDWALAAAWVVTLYGVVQWLDYRFFPDALGWSLDPFIWRKAFGSRIFSTLANPDLLAAFLTGIFPLAVTSFLGSAPLSSAAVSPDDGKDPSCPKILFSIVNLRSLLALSLLPLIVFNLIYSWSVKGLFAFVPTGIIFLLLSCKFLRGYARRMSVISTALLLFAIGCCFLINPHKLREQAAYNAAFLKHTWSGTLNLIREHPWIGTGPGSFYVTYPGFRKPEIIRLEKKHNTETNNPENWLLEIWSELGIVGLILALWLFAGLIRAAINKIHASVMPDAQEDTLWLIGIFSSVLGFLLVGLTNALGTAFVSPGTMFWLLAGVLGGVAATHLERDIKFSVYPFPVPGLISRLIYLPAFAVIGLLGCGSVRWFVSDIELNIGIYHAKQSQWEQALSRFNKMTPGMPEYVMAQYFIGNVCQDRGEKENLEKAVVQYQKVKRLAPHYVQVDHQLGTAYSRLASWDEAIESFTAAEKLDPLFEPNYKRLARAYLKKREKDRALEVYGRR
ncbi:MAG: O-antigen ligase family protein [Elusimicrobia bacterium]|nr:O-antigen ligase family protein [Elusimicrobiota bacterium]